MRAERKAFGIVPVVKMRLKRRSKMRSNGLPPALIYSVYILSKPGLFPFLRLLTACSSSLSKIGGIGSSLELSIEPENKLSQ